MPVTASCHTHVGIIVATAVPTKKPCVMVSSCGRVMVTHGESSPLKDLAISAKPGGSVCICAMGLPSGVFTHWLEIVQVSVIWLNTVQGFAPGVMVSFEHPILWVTGKRTPSAGSPISTVALLLHGFKLCWVGGLR